MNYKATPSNLRALAVTAWERGADTTSRVLESAATRIAALEDALAARDATIQAAPHAKGCHKLISGGVAWIPGTCTCWKAQYDAVKEAAHE